jgi:hypothetical protein
MSEGTAQGPAGVDAPERRGIVTPADVAAALLPLHAANTPQALAEAIGALSTRWKGGGSLRLPRRWQRLARAIREQSHHCHVAALPTGDSERPLTHVFETGEIVVLDSLADLVGECQSFRRAASSSLRWKTRSWELCSSSTRAAPA